MSEHDNSIADDILRGASAIAIFLHGDAAKRRSVYHEASRGRLPTFRFSGRLCARKSTLIKFIEDQENR